MKMSGPLFKRWLVGVACLLAASVLMPAGAFADLNVTIDAGYLRIIPGTDIDTTSSDPGVATDNGALLLLVDIGTSTTNPLTTPAGNFGNFGTVLGAFSINNFGLGGTSLDGNGQETSSGTFTDNPTAFGAAQGDNVEILWFPSIKYTTYAADEAGNTTGSLLTTGTMYGAYNPLFYATNGTNDAPDGGDNWVLPANGAGAQYIFATTDDVGGSQLATEGLASDLITPLPEPSTYAMLGLGALGLAGMKLRQRYARQS